MDFSGFSAGASSGHGEVDRTLYGMLEAEGARYASFFTTLDQVGPQRISRSTATAFFAKSSLSDAEVEALYTAIKSVGLVPDASVLSETEFILGMHMIVCMTKRGLATLPSPFPTYLFPSLNLPAVREGFVSSTGRGSFGFASPSPPSAFGGTHADLISSMPSPEKPNGAGCTAGVSMARCSFSSTGNSDDSTATTPESGPLPTELVKLHDAASIIDLAHKEVQNNSVLQTQLRKVDESENKTLEYLRATLEALAVAVEHLGFPIPSSARASIGALDDLGNLLRASVQSVKQEIQSLEISAQMRSVADEATSRTNSSNSNNSGSIQSDTTPRPSDAVATITTLTQQLAVLQAEAKQLQTKKDSLARQVVEAKKPTETDLAATATASIKTVSGSSTPLAASSSWGDVSASAGASSATTVAPLAPPQDSVQATENTTMGFSSSTPFATSATPPLDTSAFGFGPAFAVDIAPPPVAGDAQQQPQDNDFGGWGAFQ